MGNKHTHINIWNGGNHDGNHDFNHYKTLLRSGVVHQHLPDELESGKQATGIYHLSGAADGSSSMGGVIRYTLRENDRKPRMIAVMVAVPPSGDRTHKFMFALGVFPEEIACDESLYKLLFEGKGNNIKRGFEETISLTAYGITIKGSMVEHPDKLELSVRVNE